VLVKRLGLVVVVASTAMLLASCSQNPPGVAADVDGSHITDSEVDEFALVLCSLNAPTDGSAAEVTPSKGVRTQALSLLLNIDMAAQIADPETADSEQVGQAVTQAASSREQVPADLRDVFDKLVKDYAIAQLSLTALGQESLTQQGQPAGDAQAAFTEGDRLRTEFAKTADITIDPRFGSLVDGVLTPSSGSLSVAVSNSATEADTVPPAATFTATLPVSQTCS
jgi:hypothetical protein